MNSPQRLTLEDALNLASSFYNRGDLGNAESIYRQILAAAPDHPDALHLLGVIKYQTNDNAAAIELIRRAIAVNPHVSFYHNNLAGALSASGQHDQAVASYREALRLQ